MSPNKKNLPDFSFFSEHQVNSSSSVIFFLTLTAMIYSQNDSVLTLIDHLERKQKLSIDADLYTVDKGKTMLQKLSVGEVFILKNLRFEERDGILKVIYDFFFLSRIYYFLFQLTRNSHISPPRDISDEIMQKFNNIEPIFSSINSSNLASYPVG